MADSEKEVAAATAAASVPAQSQVDTAAAATSPAHRAQSSSRQQHEKSPSLNASAPSFNPGKAKGRAPPRAPSVASSQGQPRPPSAASTSSRAPQKQQQQRQQTQQSFRSRPAVPIEPRGYIPPAVQTTRKSDVDVDARIVAARLKAEEARKKFEAAEAERIAYEQQVQQEQKTAHDKAERDRKLAEDMSAHREAARQKKLRAMTETTGSESGKGAGVSEEYRSPPMSASRSSLVDHAAEDSDDEEERLLQQLKALKLRKRKEAERNKRIEALRKQIEDEEAEILASSPTRASTTREASEKSFTAKLYEKKKGADHAYSPGYGVRGPNEYSHLPLPPDEERVTEHGSVHRMYPAPAPRGEIKNADAGWDDYDNKAVSQPSAEQSQEKEAENSRKDADDGGWTDTINQSRREETRSVAEKRGHDAPPHLQSTKIEDSAPSTALQTPATGSYVKWEGVVYTRDDHFKELEDEKFDIRNAFADKPDRMTPRASGPNGYGGGYGGGGGGYGDRQQDNGYGSRNKTDGGAGGNADAWGSGGGAGGGGAQGWDNAVDSYGSGGGYGGAGGGYGGAGGGADDGCRICKDPGHWAKECPKKDECHNCGENGHRRSDCDKGPKCRNCEQFGHMSFECPEPRQGGGGLRGQCFNCGEVGHNRADCDKPVDESKFFGECHNCGERGHRSRDCPKERTGDSGGYGGNGGGYGGSGGGYGGNGNFAGGDRTTTAGGRSAWGDRADNGYGSRNKAGEDGDKGGDNGWGSGGNSGGDRAGGDDDGWGAPAPAAKTEETHGGGGGGDGWGDSAVESRPEPASRYDAQSATRNEDDWGAPRLNSDARDHKNGCSARSREGSVQVEPQAKARVAAAMGMNPERMRMAGMSVDQVSLSRSRQPTDNGASRSGDDYHRRDAAPAPAQERGRETSRYGDFDGGRYGGQESRYGRDAEDREVTPPARREPLPPARRAPSPAPAASDDFGGW